MPLFSFSVLEVFGTEACPHETSSALTRNLLLAETRTPIARATPERLDSNYIHGVTVFKEDDSVRKPIMKHAFDGNPKLNARVKDTTESSLDQPAIDGFDLHDECERYDSTGMLDVKRSLGFGFLLRRFVNDELTSHPPRAIRCKRATDSSNETVCD
jgi:hypothetical protein